MKPDASFDEMTLMAYADGELDADTRSAVEAAMAADPQVASRVAEHVALKERLRTTFDPVLRESVPTRLLEQVRSTDAPQAAVVTRLDEKRSRRAAETTRSDWHWPEWGAIAASVVVGVAFAQLFLRSSEPLVARNGDLFAEGSLAAALSEQLAGTQADDASVYVGLSFRNRAGDYCRTFHLDARLAGLACRDEEGWRLKMLTESAAAAGTPGNYRLASAPLPPAVLSAIENEIEGEPLDADGEAAARQRGWR